MALTGFPGPSERRRATDVAADRADLTIRDAELTGRGAELSTPGIELSGCGPELPNRSRDADGHCWDGGPCDHPDHYLGGSMVLDFGPIHLIH